MSKRDQVISMWMAGHTRRSIAAATGLTPKGVYHYTKDVMRPKRWNPINMQTKGVNLGRWHHMTDEACNLVMKKIRGTETVIACMARIIVEMSKQEEPK